MKSSAFAAAACGLAFLWTPARAATTYGEIPVTRRPTASSNTAPVAAPAPVTAPPPIAPPAPATAPALSAAPAPLTPAPAPAPQPTVVFASSAPALSPVSILPPSEGAPLGAGLRGKIKEDKRHYDEKVSTARREFDARQAEERKAYEEAPPGSGFWERRRLAREFRAEQEKRRREFVAEQEEKRKTYEWRYP